jgi:predicted nucleic acid-binding protein
MKKSKKTNEVIVDTDIIVALLKGDHDIAGRLEELLEQYTLFITPVTVTEVISVVNENEQTLISQLFDIIRVLNVNKEIGTIAGSFLKPEAAGSNLTIGSAVIAASVAYYKFPFWTLNPGFYPMLDKNDFFDY